MRTLKSFLKNSRGNAVVEFAIILPMLLILLSGSYEIVMYSLLHNKVARIAGTLSNVVSLQNLNRDQLNMIVSSAEVISAPFEFDPTTGSQGVVISHVRNEGETQDPLNMVVSWQAVDGSMPSRIGAEGGPVTSMPNNLALVGKQSAIVVEVFYTYEPLIFKNFMPPVSVYKTHVSMPRIATMNVLLGETL